VDSGADIAVSSETGQNMDALVALLVERAKALLPHEGEVAINARHRKSLAEAQIRLEEALRTTDQLLAAEALRLARVELDRVTGRAGVEDMLDALFGSFCIGK
jgi:tRNA modification GTPase